jgi:Helix-turn-helix domain
MDRITYEERRRIAGLVAEGAPRWKLHLEINRSRHAIRRAVIALQRPARREPKRSPLRLSPAEREEISRGLAAGRSLRGIASGLGRAPSTVCREVAANGGRGRYRALRRGPAGPSPGAPSPAGQAGPVPAAACGRGGQAGAALAAGADRGLAEGGLPR